MIRYAQVPISRFAIRSAIIVCLLTIIAFYDESTVNAALGGIDGYITDQGTGLPIENIYVIVDNGDGSFPGATTNASGYYFISGVNPGLRNVVAARGCCGSPHPDVDVQYAMAHDYNVNVSGGNTTRKNFTLTKQMGNVSVTLVGESTCIANIDIVVDSTQNNAYGIGRTDTSGHATIARIRPGTEIYVTTLKKGDCNQGRAGPITVNQGATTNVTITQTKGGYLFVGRVNDESGNPINNASIFINPSSGHTGNVCNATTSSLVYGPGHFECYLQPSTYDVHIEGISQYPPYIYYGLPVVNNPTTQVFTLIRGSATLRGTVKNMADEPIVSARVQPFAWFNPGNWADLSTDEAGYYQGNNFQAGQYQIFCTASEYESQNKVVTLLDGTNTVDFVLRKNTALLLVRPSSYYVLGEYDATDILTLTFTTANGGITGSADWSNASVSVTPSHIMTVTTLSGTEGTPLNVQVDPRGLIVGNTYTGTLTVIGVGDSGTRQVTIVLRVVEDIQKVCLPVVLKSFSN